MPYYKRRYPRRFTRRAAPRKSSGGGTLSTIGNIARTALKIGKFVASVVNVEAKFYDQAIGGTYTNGDNTASWLSGITVGTASNQRNGQSVLAKSLFIRGNIVMNAAATTQVLRVLVVMDKQRGGTTPTISDVLESSGVGWINSPLTMQQAGRFVVLSDRNYDMSINGNNRSLQYKFFCKLKHHIRWDESGNAIGDAEQGQLYLLAVSNDGVNPPTFDFHSRLRFIDN